MGEALMEVSGDRLKQAGDTLRTALIGLIATEGGAIPRPTDLARGWKLDQTLCIRVCSALKASDSLSVLHQLPSTGSLRTLLAAARKREVSEEAASAADLEIGLLEDLIRTLGGKKANLDTLIGSQLLEARAKTEHTSKQNIFRGMSNLLGLQADVSMTSFFVYPGGESDQCNELAIYGSLRLRRLLPERGILVGGRLLQHAPDDELPRAESILHGGKIDESGYSIALKPFCTEPFPHVELVRRGRRLLYTLPGNEKGEAQESTLLFASIERDASPRYRSEETEYAEFGFVPRNPAKDSVLDIFVHKDVWAGTEPHLRIHRNDRTLSAGQGLTGDALDNLELYERVQNLGVDPRAIPLRLIPRYTELLQHVLQQVPLELGDFRLFRYHVRYPVIGLMYLIHFNLPERR